MNSIGSISRSTKTIFITLLGLSTTLCSCDLILPNPYIQPIAESIEIGPDWLAMTPVNPLKVVREVQIVSIQVPKIPDWRFDSKENIFISPDGSLIKIEMQLISSDGEVFTMNTIGMGPGLTFSYIPNKKVHVLKTRFPKGVIIEEIRIYANRQVKGGQVDWICRTEY